MHLSDWGFPTARSLGRILTSKAFTFLQDSDNRRPVREKTHLLCRFCCRTDSRAKAEFEMHQVNVPSEDSGMPSDWLLCGLLVLSLNLVYAILLAAKFEPHCCHESGGCTGVSSKVESKLKGYGHENDLGLLLVILLCEQWPRLAFSGYTICGYSRSC